MKFSTSILAVAAVAGFVAAAPAAVPASDAATSPALDILDARDLETRQSYYTLTSYNQRQCGAYRGYDVFYKNICSKLDYYSRSIKFQRKDGQLPKGCTLYGYATDYCTGKELLVIAGPTNDNTCYQTNDVGYFQAYVQSVKLVCY